VSMLSRETISHAFIACSKRVLLSASANYRRENRGVDIQSALG
jgi:hypothetical protein